MVKKTRLQMPNFKKCQEGLVPLDLRFWNLRKEDAVVVKSDPATISSSDQLETDGLIANGIDFFKFIEIISCASILVKSTGCVQILTQSV